MSALELRDQSIITQVAAKIAADLAQSAKDVRIEDLLADFAVAFPVVQEAITDSINAAIATGAFGGSTVVPGAGPAPAAGAAATAPAAGPPAGGPPRGGPAPAGPASIPGATAGGNEADWKDLWDNPGDWYDNQTTKKSEKHPDFRHKTRKDAKGYNVGLYINDKGNPQWVKDHFGVTV